MEQIKQLKLSEDWLATIIGLLIVAVIGLGLLGPGVQTVTLTAEPGETASADVLALDGWRVSFKQGGESVSVPGAWTTLRPGTAYTYQCACGSILAASETPDSPEAAAGKSALMLSNAINCEQTVSLTYTRGAVIIPWPIFNLFTR